MNETSFELILHSGNSKSSSMEAIEYARQGNIQEADFKMNVTVLGEIPLHNSL